MCKIIKKICAGIILYNPNEERLRNNIESIINQVSHIYIIDNASINIDKIEEKYRCYKKVTILKNSNNAGIAYALNQACEAALLDGYEWIMTLDQDTVCPLDLIQNFIIYMNKTDVGIICPEFILNVDRVKTRQQTQNKIPHNIRYCITSASLTRLEAWKVSGRFEDKLFIDCVDYDFCIKLRLKNYRILQIKNIFVNHEVGHAKYKILFRFIKVLTYNHSEKRNYYMARNTVYLIRTYYYLWDVYVWLPRLVYYELRRIIFEPNRLHTIRSFCVGIKDGLYL